MPELYDEFVDKAMMRGDDPAEALQDATTKRLTEEEFEKLLEGAYSVTRRQTACEWLRKCGALE